MSGPSIQPFFVMNPDYMSWEDWNGNVIISYGELNIPYTSEDEWQLTANVLATNTGYSVKDFLDFSFKTVNLDWEKYVEFDQRYLRPTEVDALIGDYSKAANILGWKPQTFTPELAKIMVLNEMKD